MSKTQELDLSKIDVDAFRVAIFGSARTVKGSKYYDTVHDLAKMIGERGFDIVTGGGPGMMEAANEGHCAGDVSQKAHSIGLAIKLATEEKVNDFVEFNKNFARFAERLETFAKISNVFVVTQGGIGTMLELFYMWQLVQVKKIPFKPIILVGEMWENLVHWVIDFALRDKLISSSDFEYVYIARSNEEAIKLIDQFHQQFQQNGVCAPIKRGKVQE
jgi:uncharacterized protein (TIGR00730 family)